MLPSVRRCSCRGALWGGSRPVRSGLSRRSQSNVGQFLGPLMSRIGDASWGYDRELPRSTGADQLDLRAVDTTRTWRFTEC